VGGAQFSSINASTNPDVINVNGGLIPEPGAWNIAVFNPNGFPVNYTLSVSHVSGSSTSPAPAFWLAFTSAPRFTAGGVNLDYLAAAGVRYLLESSDDLVNWTPVTEFNRTPAQPLPNQPYYYNRLEVPLEPAPADAPRRYYRLRTVDW
jgi:hypothetical protein